MNTNRHRQIQSLALAAVLALTLACAEEEKIGETQVGTGTTSSTSQTTTGTSDTTSTTSTTPKKPVSRGAVIVTFYKGSATAAFLSLSASPSEHKLTDALELVSTDPVVRIHSGGIYVVNRFGFDNIQILDPSANFKTKAQYSVGNGSNPHDILVLSASKAYVTRYEPTFDDILMVNPSTGQETGKIALSGMSGLNSTRTPRPDQMLFLDGKVYVILQNITPDFAETGSSLLAVIDPTTDKLVDVDPSTPTADAIDLGVRNAGGMAVYNGNIFIPAAGDYGAADPAATAGVVKVDPASQKATLLISGATLGGLPTNDIAITESGKGYLALSDRAFKENSYVITFDASTGTLGSKVYTASSKDGNIPEFEIDTFGHLLVLDRDPANPGVVVIDAATDAVLRDRHVLTVPPFSIAVWNELQ